MYKKFKKIYLILIIFIFCCVLIFGKQYIDKIVFAEKSADAIAIRVIPNTENYSAIRWYKEQNFKGSPQSIIIDGYSGIRDGRTVYVNIGNISSSNILYTNIYLISYNQQAERQTIDIFSQILNHWKFNTNILTIGQCSENNSINCVLDSDCQNNEYCNSQKANIIRDVIRKENLVELNEAIEKYKNIYNHYPKLSAGSYLPNKTISVWPSWQKILAQDLEIQLPNDPINKLGDCGDDKFHSITCWDKDAKEFADSDLTDPNINLPENSKVYVYTTTKNGNSYNICSVMESGYIQGLQNGACNNSKSFIKSKKTTNHQPTFIDSNLFGETGFEYKGYIKATDQDGDKLTWTINTGAAEQWASWDGGNPPILKYLTINNQIMIYSEKAGSENSYNFSVTINDNNGGVAVQNYVITTKNNNLPIIQSIQDKIITIGKNLSIDVTAVEKDNQYPLTFTFNGLPNNFSNSFTDIANNLNKHDYHLNNLIEGSIGDYYITITASDIYGGISTPINFKLTVVNKPPIINTPLNCDEVVKINKDYNCTITAFDPDNHNITFNFTGLPPGLSGNQNTGIISGIPTTIGNYTIDITAIDQYGAISSPESYNLETNLKIAIANNTGNINNTGWGSGVGVNIIQTNDWLEVVPISTPYIWVASSGSDSVYRIDTATNALTGPFTVGDNPSRTAVAINGDVWIGNRGSNNITHLNTDGNFIKTCPVGDGPRGVAIDASGNVWIGNYGDGTVQKLDYNTCSILENYTLPNASSTSLPGVYGAAVDGLGNVWMINGHSAVRDLIKIEISTGIVTNYSFDIYFYGIAVDKNNNIWLAGWGSKRVYKINQSGVIVKTINLGMNCRGIAVDKNNNIWVTHSLNDRVTKLNNNGDILFTVCSDTIDCNTTLGAHPIGITATADGYIWAVNYSTHRASKINPDTGNIITSVNVGLKPYTYSDMAGYMLRSVTLAGGNWTYTVDSTINDPSWGVISWTETEPSNSYARVRVRSAINQTGLNSAIWSNYFDTSPVNLSAISGINKRWLQIQADLHLSIDDISPTIDDLSITCYP